MCYLSLPARVSYQGIPLHNYDSPGPKSSTELAEPGSVYFNFFLRVEFCRFCRFCASEHTLYACAGTAACTSCGRGSYTAARARLSGEQNQQHPCERDAPHGRIASMARSIRTLKYIINSLESEGELNFEKQQQLDAVKLELEQVREANRNKGHHRKSPAYRAQLKAKKLEAVDRKIAKKEHAINYFRLIRETNPSYFDKMVSKMEFDLRVLRNERQLISDE